MAEPRRIDPINALRQRRYEAGHGDAEGFRRPKIDDELKCLARLIRLSKRFQGCSLADVGIGDFIAARIVADDRVERGNRRIVFPELHLRVAHVQLRVIIGRVMLSADCDA